MKSTKLWMMLVVNRGGDLIKKSAAQDWAALFLDVSDFDDDSEAWATGRAAAIATTTAGAAVRASARGARRGGRAVVGDAAFGQGGLTREFDAVLLVHGDDLHQHGVAHTADIVDRLNVAVGEFADVDQAVLTGHDFNKRAEVLDGNNLAFVDLARLHAHGQGLDPVAGAFGRFGFGAGEGDHGSSCRRARSGGRSCPG